MDDWFTVVIPTRDSALWIGTLLQHYSIRGVSPVLLLDARTRDNTRLIAEQFRVTIVDIDDFRFAENLVQRTRDVVSTPWALFLNDDEIPSEKLFERLRGKPPSDAVQSVAIPRRWAWYEPGKPLLHGRSFHWQDRAEDNGADHHWRLFRPLAVKFISKMHTDGFLIDKWARLPPDEYLVHFEWVLRTRHQRAEKLKRYDRHRYGFGKFFHNMYLPEDQPAGTIEYAPFDTDVYDVLATAYYAARKPDQISEAETLHERIAYLLHRSKVTLLFNSFTTEPRDRIGLKPRLENETPIF